MARSALGLAAGLGVARSAAAQTPPAARAASRPLIVSTWPFGQPANNAALKTLIAGGSVLDAVEQGIRFVEASDNPSVGLGGLPNAAGVVQLDACIMLGAGHKAGSVAGLEGIRHPISAARRVMEKTPHVMLVGEGARLFALEQGLEAIEIDSATRYAEWTKKRAAEKAAPATGKQSGSNHDTIAMLVLGADGLLAGGCSTSGWSGKLPGRVGDSPIIGSGLYVDEEVGAAGATGLGENVMRYCGSFLVVELMRQGLTPQDACSEALRRMTRQDPAGAALSVSFIAIDKQGRYGSASAGQTFQYAVTTREGTTLIDSPGLGQLKVVPEGGNRR
jgi:isoaspartyl peptidase/L-asparaginase-like protein (Ntn-hydrolase superfamily)